MDSTNAWTLQYIVYTLIGYSNRVGLSNLDTPTQLQYHVNGCPGSNVVGFQCFVVRPVWYTYIGIL